jgi:predicted thioesterase
MLEEDEEGIGTFLTIEHKSPALVGETVEIQAVLKEIAGNAINCTFIASVGDRIIAEGTTGQKILKKEKLERMVKSITGGN